MLNLILRQDFDRILERVTPRFKDLADSRLLITGAAGFVGSYFMDLMGYANEHYFKQPCQVVGVDNWVAGSRVPTVGPDVTMIARLPPDYNAQWVIHAASIASPQLYLAHPLETLAANVALTERVLARCITAEGLLHLSTSEVYGDTTEVPTLETCLGRATFSTPRAVYHESKRYGEMLCQVHHRLAGVPVKIARPFYIYGPGENLGNGRMVPQLIKAALRGEAFTIYGEGKATRSLCYISDAVEQLLVVMLDGEPGEAYNVGTADEISIGEFAQLGARLFDVKVVVVPDHATLTADAPSRRVPDLHKLRALGAPPPRVGLAMGLERTHRYYDRQERDRGCD